MDNDSEVENILIKRTVPSMSSNLEHRIIKSITDSADNAGYNRSIFLVICDNLMLPKPVLSLAVVLVIGVFIGFYSGGINNVSNNYIDEFFLDYGELEYGEFL